MDYQSSLRLQPKVKNVIGGLGIAAHFQTWGYEKSRLREMDWYNQHSLKKGIGLRALPARHFSGRTLKRNPSLWLSFSISSWKRKLYLGGDSGYGPHFKAIGALFGPFDLAILECGQYNQDWKYVHLLPQQFFPAATDLRAKAVLPVHHSKFSLARHSWDAPLKAVFATKGLGNSRLLTPHIGEPVNLDIPTNDQTWWQGLE